MTFNLGEVYRAKTGEILEVAEFENGEFCFRIRHPETLEMTDNALTGPLEQLKEFTEDVGLEKIDLETYKPTGLVKN